MLLRDDEERRTLMNITYRPEAIKAAKELYYGKEIIKQLKAAKNDNEISRIMRTARERRLEK